MRYSLFHVEREQQKTLQTQIREMLVSAMLAGQLPSDAPVPSTRAMAKRLKVSRNTVMLAYQALAVDGYLISRERSGFYVSPDVRENLFPAGEGNSDDEEPATSTVDWASKLHLQPSKQINIVKPTNWHDYPYPFIYGQVDPKLFPISSWRDCIRQSLSLKWLDAWTDDRYNEDDPMLVEQIQQRILTGRGVMANRDEILVTMGAQNALYLLSHLLVRQDTKVAVEDPGYPDIRNMLRLRTQALRHIPVDLEGISVEHLKDAELVYVTPSHQYPTNVTMGVERRKELLDWAENNDSLIVEDDYEYETNFRGEPTPALKSLDRNGRVIYVGSLSKSLMPGIRVGYVVAPKELISELRAMRRLVLRHPPGNNQRVVALFLSLGIHNALVNKLSHTYQKRSETLSLALASHFHGWYDVPRFGGSSFWINGPEQLDVRKLVPAALQKGVLIEPGDVFFSNPHKNRSFFRLGFSSIADDKIEPGIKELSECVSSVM